MHLRVSDDELATLVEMVSLATEMAALNPNDGGQAGYARFEEVENKVLEAAKSTGLAERDLIREIGPATHEALNEEERRKKAVPLEKRYWEKFQKDGTDLLFWIDRNEDA